MENKCIDCGKSISNGIERCSFHETQYLWNKANEERNNQKEELLYKNSSKDFSSDYYKNKFEEELNAVDVYGNIMHRCHECGNYSYNKSYCSRICESGVKSIRKVKKDNVVSQDSPFNPITTAKRQKENEDRIMKAIKERTPRQKPDSPPPSRDIFIKTGVIPNPDVSYNIKS